MAETAKAFGDFCEGAAAGFSPAATALIEGCGFKILILEAGGWHIRPNGLPKTCFGHCELVSITSLNDKLISITSSYAT